MSGAYGRAYDPRALGLRGGGDTYPDKYSESRWPAKPGALTAESRSPSFFDVPLLPIVLLLTLSVAFREEAVEGFDWQLGMRLAGYSLAGISVLLALGMRKLAIDRLLFAWALVPILIMLSAVYALDGLFSFTAGVAHLILLFFAWRMVTRHGQTPVVLSIVVSGLIIGVLSIVAYYIFPDIGGSAATPYTADYVYRMKGVTSQPNTLGAVAAFTVLLAVMYFQSFTTRMRVLAAAAIVISAFCLVYSDSRTSIAALGLCLLLWWVRRANVALNLFTIVAIALAACLIITFVPDVSAFLSRGEAGPDDLASLNGRSRIWDVAWESIYAHPLLGQGYGASRLILPVDDRLFGAAINTHNVYMELLFSGGVVLFGIFVLVVGASIVRSASRGRTEALIALLFFLVRGAAEAAPFGGLPLYPALAFYAAVALCLSGSARQRAGDYPRHRTMDARLGTAAPRRGTSRSR